MFKQLLWKEWRENLWKLNFCLVVSVAFSALLFRIRLIPDLNNCIIFSMVTMFMVPVIYALDLFAGEMSHRTIHLLFRIPVPRWQIFFSKMAVAMIGFIVIFGISGLAMEMWTRGRETQAWLLLAIHLNFGLSAAAIFVWFSVFGCQNRSEAASLVAMVGVLIGWAIVLFSAGICQVQWAPYFTPYIHAVAAERHWHVSHDYSLPQLALSQTTGTALALSIACFRYTKIRRVL